MIAPLTPRRTAGGTAALALQAPYFRALPAASTDAELAECVHELLQHAGGAGRRGYDDSSSDEDGWGSASGGVGGGGGGGGGELEARPGGLFGSGGGGADSNSDGDGLDNGDIGGGSSGMEERRGPGRASVLAAALCLLPSVVE
jgi:hypothetical protein